VARGRHEELTIGAVDLFCVSGDYSRLLNAGIGCSAGFRRGWRLQAMLMSQQGGEKFVLANLAKVLPSDVIKRLERGRRTPLAGCAPVKHSRHIHKVRIESKRPMESAARILRGSWSDANLILVTMENVAAFRTRGVDEFVRLAKKLFLKSSGKFWIAGSTASTIRKDWFLSHLVWVSKIAEEHAPRLEGLD